MRHRWLAFGLIFAVLAVVAAGCGGGDDNGGSAEGSEDVTGDISAMAIWGGTEQESFQAVIDGFNELYPNVNVKYTSGGDNLAPLLSTAVQGGNPPDIACIGQPGLMKSFADQGAIQPIDDLRDKIVENFGESVADVGSVDGTQYAVFEPNDQKLWEGLKRTVSSFLRGLWRDGALFGATAEQAFYVKCDSETNPPESIDQGKVVVEVGIAPVKPAEFVIFRIAQIKETSA